MQTHVCRCPGGDHPTFGACMRAKNIRVGWARSAAGFDLSTEKQWERGLQEYRDARRQGVQPQGTRRSQVRVAMQLSEAMGEAYGGNTADAG